MAGAQSILSGKVVEGDRAVFRQIADHLREAIDDGRLKPGDQLPSEADLIGHYAVTRKTIRDALAILRTEGLVVAQHGRGVFVRRPSKVRRFAAGRNPDEPSAARFEVGDEREDAEVAHVKVERRATTAAVAKRLGVKAGEKALEVTFLRVASDGRRVSSNVSIVPLRAARSAGFDGSAPGEFYGALARAGTPVDEIDEEIYVRPAGAAERSSLGVELGVPVVAIERVARAKGQPVELRQEFLVADGTVLKYRLNPG